MRRMRCAVLMVAAAIAAGQGPATNGPARPGTATQPGEIVTAGKGALPEVLAALQKVHQPGTIEARFVCLKHIANLNTALISRGRLWAGPDASEKESSSLRVSTEAPYVSQLIFAGGRVFGRSQHESEWTSSEQSGRPGPTMVMVRWAGWCRGNTGKLEETYSVARGAEMPPAELLAQITGKPSGRGKLSGVQGRGGGLDLYVLTPRKPEMAAAIRQVALGFGMAGGDEKDAPAGLRYMAIETAEGDRVYYMLSDVHRDESRGTAIFEPGGMIPATDEPAK